MKGFLGLLAHFGIAAPPISNLAIGPCWQCAHQDGAVPSKVLLDARTNARATVCRSHAHTERVGTNSEEEQQRNHRLASTMKSARHRVCELGVGVVASCRRADEGELNESYIRASAVTVARIGTLGCLLSVWDRLRSETNRQQRKTQKTENLRCIHAVSSRAIRKQAGVLCRCVGWHTIATRHQRGEAQGWALHAECSV